MARRPLRPPAIDPGGLRDAALNHLTRFDASPERLRAVLRRRIARAKTRDPELPEEAIAAAEAAIADIIADLSDSGVIDADGYAERQMRRALRSGASLRSAQAKAAMKGGDAAAAQRAADQVSHANPDADLHAAAAYLRRRRLGPYGRTEDAQDLHKAMAALARRGFSRPISERLLTMGDSDEIEALLAVDAP